MSSLSKQLRLGLPEQYGLYNPREEKDACGVGFVCDIKGRASNQIIRDAAHMNCCMDHREVSATEPNSGDGAIMTGLPHPLFKRVVKRRLVKTFRHPAPMGQATYFCLAMRASGRIAGAYSKPSSMLAASSSSAGGKFRSTLMARISVTPRAKLAATSNSSSSPPKGA